MKQMSFFLIVLISLNLLSILNANKEYEIPQIIRREIVPEIPESETTDLYSFFEHREDGFSIEKILQWIDKISSKDFSSLTPILTQNILDGIKTAVAKVDKYLEHEEQIILQNINLIDFKVNEVTLIDDKLDKVSNQTDSKLSPFKKDAEILTKALEKRLKKVTAILDELHENRNEFSKILDRAHKVESKAIAIEFIEQVMPIVAATSDMPQNLNKELSQDIVIKHFNEIKKGKISKIKVADMIVQMYKSNQKKNLKN